MKKLNQTLSEGLLFTAGILLIIAIAVMMMCSGCGTISETYTFDKDGNPVLLEKVNADIIGSVLQSTKDKSVLIIHRGWAFGLSVSPGTVDDPTPHGKILCGKFFDVWFSINGEATEKLFESVAKIIEAADAPLTASTSGVSEGTKTK